MTQNDVMTTWMEKQKRPFKFNRFVHLVNDTTDPYLQ